LLIFGILRRARVVVPVLTALFFGLKILLLVDKSFVVDKFPDFLDQYLISLGLIFLFGACLAMYARQIPYSKFFGAGAGLVTLATLVFGGYQLVGVAALAYFVLFIAAALPQPLRAVGRRNDYSYGVYIYGFLVQQVLASVGLYRLGYVPYLLASLLISMGMGWLSWHVVEKRALALKDRGPGRGVRYWIDAVKRRRAPVGDLPEQDAA
jgi:peptidoglycan/LPS O-acetylase OafA/YrhL